MNKKMKLITTLSILGISLGAGNTFANETVEYDPTQDPDSIEYQPDPGPLNQMGRPEYWEDTTSEEDNENAENNQSMQTEGIVQEDENDGKPHSITTSQGGSVEYEVPSHTNEANLELANPNIDVDTSLDVVGPVY